MSDPVRVCAACRCAIDAHNQFWSDFVNDFDARGCDLHPWCEDFVESDDAA